MYISEEECKECGLCCWIDSKTLEGKKESIIQDDGYCLHYDKKIGCKIYDTRSQACRDYERGGAWCLERRKLKDILIKE